MNVMALSMISFNAKVGSNLMSNTLGTTVPASFSFTYNAISAIMSMWAAAFSFNMTWCNSVLILRTMELHSRNVLECLLVSCMMLLLALVLTVQEHQHDNHGPYFLKDVVFVVQGGAFVWSCSYVR